MQSSTKPKPYAIKGQTQKKSLKFKLQHALEKALNFHLIFQHKRETPNFI